MAEDKMQIVMEESRKRRMPYAGMSIFFLSLLLSATVAALIFMSLNSHSVSCAGQSAETRQPDVTAKIKVDMDDKEVDEKIEYSESRDVVVIYGADGSFLADDYSKGISVMNFGDSYNCFVVPIGSNRTKTRHDLKIAISNYDGERIALNDRQQNFEVMPGYVKDASFLPQEAKNRCLTYQWLVAVKHGMDESSRAKRDIVCPFVCRRYLYLEDGDLKIAYRCLYFCYDNDDSD